MAINFPSSPSTNDIFTSGGTSWSWSGTTWNLYLGSNLVTTSSLSSTLSSYATTSNPSLSNTTLGSTTTINGSATFTNKPTIPGYQTTITYASSPPASPSLKDLYVDSDLNLLYMYISLETGWVAIGSVFVAEDFQNILANRIFG